RVLFAEGNEAMQATRYEDAEQLLEMAAQYATGELRAQILFFQGYAIFQQGNQIARANGTGAAGPARQALELFQRARPLVEAGSNAQKEQLLNSIDQYIANQEAIIRAAG